MKVAICTPTYTRPHPAYLKALEDAVPALDAAGIEHKTVFEIENPYISCARATMLRKALDWKADTICFLDHDVAFRPEDLVKLIETKGEFVMGTYRFKTPTVEEEVYMGKWFTDDLGRPVLRDDGCFKASCGPAGFLKITQMTVCMFMQKYPELNFGPLFSPTPDFFNHGAIEGLWFGEDYAACKRWNELGGDIWIIPDLDVDHHHGDKVYPGNLHRFMMKQPGGANFVGAD